MGPVLFALLYFLLSQPALSYKGVVVLSLGAWMVTWWVSEAAPLPVTALLPMILLLLLLELTILINKDGLRLWVPR